MEVMQAVLSNARHPEYGTVTISFPIPLSDYEQVLRQTASLDIGEADRADCLINEVNSVYPILRRLDRNEANLEELDYLADRLDGFDYYELAQFQALAHARGICGVPDLINLTFNSQQVTVIEDFSDLETIGNSHYLTTHGGSAAASELAMLDGREEALRMMYAQEGTITPYGVLYENGLKLEQVYDGRTFPLYTGTPAVLNMQVGAENSSVWLGLPMPDKRLDRMLQRSGLDISKAQIKSYESGLPDELDAAIDFENTSLSELNRLCQGLQHLDRQGLDKLAALTHLVKVHDAAELQQLSRKLDQFELIPGVHDSWELGRYMIQKSDYFAYDFRLEDFYDYRGYAEQWLTEHNGRFTMRGFISYSADTKLDQLLRDSPAPPDFYMRGME